MPRQIATHTDVGLQQLLEFIRPRHHMVLITSRADSSPQSSPVAGGVDGPEALDGFVDYFRSIAGEHSDLDEYRAAMVDQGTSLLRITPTRWSTVSTGGFPPQDS